MIRCEILTFFDQTFSTIAQLKKETTPVAPAFFQSVLFMAICQILLSHLMADIASWIQILVTLKLICNGLKSFLKENSYFNEAYIVTKNELFTSYFHEKRI